MTIVHKKEGNFMITNETNTNQIQQKYLSTLSEINSEVEKLVNQFFVDEILPTIEKIKWIDYNKAFKNALIERYKDSPLSKGLGNLIDKNNSTTTNFISTKICIILQKFEEVLVVLQLQILLTICQLRNLLFQIEKMMKL